jgi:nuclear GTP-binding protein
LDPVPAATLILERLSADQALFDKMIEMYHLPEIIRAKGQRAATDFLIHVARKRGRLGKGGVPDLQSAARAVVNDWCDGRLLWFTQPPSLLAGVEASGARMGSSQEQGTLPALDKQIVSTWAAEFDLSDINLVESAA